MKALKYYLSAIVLALFLGSCAYNFIVQEDVPDTDNPDAEEVSFAGVIVPIFEAKCTRCHTTGKQIPDLSAANAFTSLSSTRYVNKTTPETSLIYTHPTGSHAATLSAAEAANVLLWIKQGAKNN